MSKLYSIKEETLVAIADNVRAITGTTGELTPGEMTTSSSEISTEVDTQTELIEQIQTALAGKAGGSGGVTLPTLDNPALATDILSGKEAIDGSGNKITGSIATKTSSNLTASGATVTVPAGYYASQATKSVATATQATPSISISTAGKITASATQTAGYVTAGTKTGTKQLTTQAAKIITPSTSSQTAVAKNVYTTGAVTVAAIPSKYEDVGIETASQTTQLASLGYEIAALETELANKAAGSGGSGGSVETCTVTFQKTTMSSTVWLGSCTTLNNGNIIGEFYFDSSVSNGLLILGEESEYIISNVVCGTVIDFWGQAYMPEWSINGSYDTLLNQIERKALRINGDTTIIFTDMD